MTGSWRLWSANGVKRSGNEKDLMKHKSIINFGIWKKPGKPLHLISCGRTTRVSRTLRNKNSGTVPLEFNSTHIQSLILPGVTAR